MRDAILVVIGVLAGRYGPELLLLLVPRLWRKVRRAQAAQKPEYADGQWFADTTPDPPLSQAQIGDAPQLNKISFRSAPGRRRVRRNGR